MSKKRELFYIIALIVSLLTNVGMFLMPKNEPEQINYYSIDKPEKAVITDNIDKSKSAEKEEDIKEKNIINSNKDDIEENLNNANTNTNKSNKININTAKVDELIKLNGIGKSTANEIIKFRQKQKFIRINDIMLVKGIGEKKFNDIKNFIMV